MKRRVAVLLLLTLASCGGAVAGEPLPDREEAAAREVRTVLTDADRIAKGYGREHLGHYLDLDTATLLKRGLDLPARVLLIVHTDHTGYCIRSIAPELPQGHAWAIATTGSAGAGPSPNDRCEPTRY